jgi:hypothetical protein|tara:strand:- start:96 stop:374 length:279 start_codon:yes stop_codon:yes gene_type:complete
MSYLVMSKAQLLEANKVAKENKWPRRFEKLELTDELNKFHPQQEWPILFHVKKRPECWRVLFEHDNGELYQLDVEDSIFNSLTLRLEEERKN